MNILEAMKYVKEGKKVCLGDVHVRLNDEGRLVRDYKLAYKVKSEEIFNPTVEQMVSDNWQVIQEEISAGATVRVCETDLVVYSGYRGRRYLVDTYNFEIVFEYENEDLMIGDIIRRGGVIVWN